MEPAGTYHAAAPVGVAPPNWRPEPDPPTAIAPLALFCPFSPWLPLFPSPTLVRRASLHLGAFLCQWHHSTDASRPHRCHQPLSGENRKQYNDVRPVMPAHTHPTWRAQPLPLRNRDCGTRMPGGVLTPSGFSGMPAPFPQSNAHRNWWGFARDPCLCRIRHKHASRANPNHAMIAASSRCRLTCGSSPATWMSANTRRWLHGADRSSQGGVQRCGSPAASRRAQLA
jgi:hypothetical protein